MGYKFYFRNLFLIIALCFPSFIIPMARRLNRIDNGGALRINDRNNIDCSICYGSYSHEEAHTLSCKHTFCQGCITRVLNNANREKSQIQLRCLDNRCKARFTERDLDNMKFAGDVIPQIKDMIKEYSSNKGVVPEDPKDKDWFAKNTKACPRCKTRVNKDGGCNHMTCERCAYEFCWLCLIKWPGYDKHSCPTHGDPQQDNLAQNNNVNRRQRFNQGNNGNINVGSLLVGAAIASRFVYTQYKEQQMFSPEFDAKKEKLSKVEQKAQDRIKRKAAYRQPSSILRGLLAGAGVYSLLQYTGVHLGRYFNPIANVIPNGIIRDELRGGRLVNAILGVGTGLMTKSYYDQLNQKKQKFLKALQKIAA